MADEIPHIALDNDSLYREETVSDGKSGSIRKMIPVTMTGEDDSKRTTRYEGFTTLMTPAGSLPIHFDLEADNLPAALAAFPAAAKAEIERTMNELREIQRQSASSLYVPGQGGDYGGGGPAGGQGGGRIQL